MSAHPQLPKVLREQIELEQDNGPRNKRNKSRTSRKEVRKQDRLEKKQRKSEYFSKHPSEPNLFEKRPITETFAPRKKHKASESAPEPPKPKPKPVVAKHKDISIQKKPQMLDLNPALLINGDPEEAEISRLEKLLNRGKKKRTKEDTAGFNSLLRDLDGFAGDADSDGSVTEQDLIEEESYSVSGSEGTTSYSNADEASAPLDDTADSAQSEYSEWGGVDESEDKRLDDQENPEGQGTMEEYETNGSRYIPPHLRLQQLGEDKESLMKVKRRLKGMLNRLTEQNIATILEEVNEASRTESRHDIIVATTELILESLSSTAALSVSFMVLHASFVAALYRIMGVDFAAHFVTELINSYEPRYKALLGNSASQEETTKECSNLLVLLSELYVFQVVSCVIVFDIIRELLGGNLLEAEVELLLKLARGCGPRLHQDDPEALKDIYEMMMSNISEKSIQLSSRSKFMVETMGDLKNNKSKNSGSSDGTTQSTERLKKFLSGLNKTHHLKSHEPLRFTLADIRSSETKGKWWLVGAAWSGDPLVERANKNPTAALGNTENESLLKLARKQGMNTDIRRSIFLVLMTSEDYLDAYERLTSLHLAEIQQRDIIRVLFHCCGSEATYNPFYTLVAQKFCTGSHSHKVTLQYCIWDFLRDLGEEGVGGTEVVKSFSSSTQGQNCHKAKLINLARALAWLIAKDALSLTVFKPVEFAIIKPQTREFFEIFFEQLFISSQSTSPLVKDVASLQEKDKQSNKEALEIVFRKALKVPALTRGLQYLISTIFKKRKREDDFIRWCTEIAKNMLRSDSTAFDDL